MSGAPRAPGVLVTSNFSNTTGFAWKFFFRLFDVIARQLHERGVAICLSFARIDGPVTILDPRIPFAAFELDPLRPTLPQLRDLVRNVRAHRVRFAYLTDGPSWHWLYGLLRLCGVSRIVVHSHVSVPAPYRPPPERGLRRLAKRAVTRSPLGADVVYACSEFVRDRVVQQACYPMERVHVINHGIELDRFLGGERAPGPVTIVTIARAVNEKGGPVLFEAARRLRAEHGIDGFRIRYGGSGPQLDRFRELVRELGVADVVEFLGEVDDTAVPLRDADVVVVPSIWGDAYPLSVIEGMAAGKPLVTTDVGGIPEQVRGSGAALVLAPGDAGALTLALKELILDRERRREMGARARAHAERHFREDRFHAEVVGALLRDLGLAAAPAGRGTPLQ